MYIIGIEEVDGKVALITCVYEKLTVKKARKLVRHLMKPKEKVVQVGYYRYYQTQYDAVTDLGLYEERK